MIFFYILNLILAVVLLFVEPIYFTRYFKLNPLNPLTIALIGSVPFNLMAYIPGPYTFLQNGLYNYYYQYALLVQNVFTIIHIIATIFIVRLMMGNKLIQKIGQRFLDTRPAPKPSRMIVCAVIFFILFIVSFLLVSHSYGTLNWLRNPRYGYQFGRASNGQWYAFSILFLSLATVVYSLYAKTEIRLLAVTSILLYCVYLLGSKGIIIQFALYTILILGIRRFRYFNLTCIIILVAALGLVIATFIGPNHGFNLEAIATYADYYINAARYYEKHLNGEIPLYHGEVWSSSMWALVPRGLYPNKPYQYGVLKIIDIFYPGAAESGSTPAFATVDYYADFGWAGVIICALCNATTLISPILYVLVLPRLGKMNIHNGVNYSRFLSYLYICLTAPAFMVFFGFPLNVILLVAILAFIEIVNRLRFVANTALDRSDIVSI